ncbi:hypothetical protein NP493_1194g00000 [Ridgeia piscesae]|uniref:Large ribosomal subunit protein mL50 n=1 Tax=Ridgeia piscesae TaxID=27915 RepID=A0AAD9KEN2_RIDPI|nr:hypothetical protein NP493_1194g00000 [Ridgeia piscesae]
MAACCRGHVVGLFKCHPQTRGPLVTRTAFWWSKKKDELDAAEVAALAENAPQEVEETPTRKYKQGNDGYLTKATLNELAAKTLLTTKKGYDPPANVADRVRQITENTCSVQGDWQDVSLEDRRLKFKVLTKLMTEFSHDIPSMQLNSITTIRDAVEFFSAEVRATSAFEDLTKMKLPKNLSIMKEYQRFNPDPETDAFFKGRTAYPGRDTIVTSIKYRRKYDSIKTRKEKPGYVDHYNGF